MLTSKDVQEMFKVSRQTVWRWTKNGLKSVKIGRVRRYELKDVHAFKEVHKSREVLNEES